LYLICISSDCIKSWFYRFSTLAKQRRCRRDNASLDEEEERWFEKDDDDSDSGSGNITPPFQASPTREEAGDAEPMFSLSLPKSIGRKGMLISDIRVR